MKKNMLLVIVILFIGCETGTRYDKNATTQSVPKNELQSGLVKRNDIEALLDDKEEEYYDRRVEDRSWVDPEMIEEDGVEEWVSSFSNAVVKNGLDVIKIREGRHEEYIRLVFDVSDNGTPAKEIGRYDAQYSSAKQDIGVILYGYQKFSAPLPSFPHSSVIEQIHFDQYPQSKGLKFHIKLRENAKVKIFELKNPARLVFDIKPI